jgi:CubicO group peptidase (beta-lactamase class C family)
MTLIAWVLLAQTIPGAAWQERTPDAVGLSKDKLDALRDLAGGRGCVIHKGVLAYAWGDVAKSAGVGAAAQALIGTLLMMAVDEGKLSGVDARVSEVEPRLTGKDTGITWRQLAHPVPGGGLALFSGALMGKVFRQTESEALKQRIGDVLRFQDPYSAEDSGLAISARDFARYGLLILRGGAWGERQVVSAPLTYLSISAPVGSGYRSFGWWLNGIDDQRRQLFVDGPGDLVAALGQGGKCALWILPSLDLVVSWTAAQIDDLDRSPGNPDAKLNRAVRLMVESVVR